MRIDEVIQQPGLKERLLKENIKKSIHVAVPGEVVSYDPNARTATIQPVIRDWGEKDPPPLLLDVPVFMWGNYLFTPQKGDGCLVVCADSCIDAWVNSGGVSSPVVDRCHSLSDGFAFVGFRVQGNQTIDASLLPAVSGADNGKALIVNGGQWATESIPSQLPAVSAQDDGKALMVHNGQWAKKDVPAELPQVTAQDNGKVLMVVNGAWASGTLPNASGVSF